MDTAPGWSGRGGRTRFTAPAPQRSGLRLGRTAGTGRIAGRRGSRQPLARRTLSWSVSPSLAEFAGDAAHGLVENDDVRGCPESSPHRWWRGCLGAGARPPAARKLVFLVGDRAGGVEVQPGFVHESGRVDETGSLSGVALMGRSANAIASGARGRGSHARLPVPTRPAPSRRRPGPTASGAGRPARDHRRASTRPASRVRSSAAARSAGANSATSGAPSPANGVTCSSRFRGSPARSRLGVRPPGAGTATPGGELVEWLDGGLPER